MHKGKEHILPGMVLPKVEPIGGPAGKLFYLEFKLPEDLQDKIFTLEEQIIHYEYKYKDNKDYSAERAFDGLMKSIHYRMKKIKQDHCG